MHTHLRLCVYDAHRCTHSARTPRAATLPSTAASSVGETASEPAADALGVSRRFPSAFFGVSRRPLAERPWRGAAVCADVCRARGRAWVCVRVCVCVYVCIQAQARVPIATWREKADASPVSTALSFCWCFVRVSVCYVEDHLSCLPINIMTSFMSMRLIGSFGTLNHCLRLAISVMTS
jgi:hypothetical protein